MQEIFGIIAAEKEMEWDKKSSIPESQLTWIFGLLCLVEKPLLAEQAGDLNTLLNMFLKHRQYITDPSQLASIDINICIITEYFE